MTIKTLIERLSAYDLNTEVMILDGFNGGGYPRTINCGPYLRIVKKKEEKDCPDCEGKVGKQIVVMGYGCY